MDTPTLLKALFRAASYVQLSYSHLPELKDLFEFNLEGLRQGCEHPNSRSKDLLTLHLNNEMTIVNTWNQNRLGQIAPQDGNSSPPTHYEAHNIFDDNEYYPLRKAALELGLCFGTLRQFLPIDQPDFVNTPHGIDWSSTPGMNYDSPYTPDPDIHPTPYFHFDIAEDIALQLDSFIDNQPESNADEPFSTQHGISPECEYNIQPTMQFNHPTGSDANVPSCSDVHHSSSADDKNSSSSDINNESPPSTDNSAEEKKPGKKNKLDSAPSERLSFPNGNITVAEMAAFLPQSLKSWDVIDRLISNGATSTSLTSMINSHREMPKGNVAVNSVYRMMKGSMEKRTKIAPEYKGWTVGSHKTAEGHDHESISVAGFRPYFKWSPVDTEAGDKAGLAPPVPFKDLAKNVKKMPEGHDALDLTCCVRYHQEHPEEELFYPSDFEALVQRLGGPAPVTKESSDRAVLSRGTQRGMKRKREDNEDEEPDRSGKKSKTK